MQKLNKYHLLIIVLVFSNLMNAQNKKDSSATKDKTLAKQWYETIAIRGYSQVRYNRLFETNSQLRCEQCDKSWGDNGGLFMRRMRVIINGNLSERVYMYFQTDFASSASANGLHFGQIRDAYFDLALDQHKTFRLRIGQSKVPFGFDNLQSSQIRLPLDRSDAINSATANERDMGVFFYWAPSKIRKLYSKLVSEGLKGSGDYGVFGTGIYNGQTANRPEANNELHSVVRITYPIELKGGQIIEGSLQAYTGKYVLTSDLRSTGVKGTNNFSYKDQRAAASFILYPKPFGIQAEYSQGIGPQFNPSKDSIETKKLEGGYVIVSYLLKVKNQVIIPFVRAQYYSGGKKQELDARSYNVHEMEYGIEWQPLKNFELTAMYTMSERRFEDYKLKNNFQKGSLLRLQAQLNF